MISIVIPVYNGADTIGRLVLGLFQEIGSDELQVILVNDGSRDGSHQACKRLYKEFPTQLVYVNLAKNFGEHNAVMAGLHYASGDYIVIMDDDLQNPPEAVSLLVNEAKNKNIDVVYSSYSVKQHNWFRNLGSRFTNWIASFLLDKPRKLYLSSFKCMSRFVVDEIKKYHGPFPYIDGLIFRCTSDISVVEVPHDKRRAGKSGYTFRKLVHLWLNMCVNFSVMPLRISSLLGLLFSGLGLVLSIIVVAEKLINPSLPIGWPSMVIAFMVFSGVQLFILGLIGEYLGRIYLSNNKTPQFVVKKIFAQEK